MQLSINVLSNPVPCNAVPLLSHETLRCSVMTLTALKVGTTPQEPLHVLKKKKRKKIIKKTDKITRKYEYLHAKCHKKHKKYHKQRP